MSNSKYISKFKFKLRLLFYRFPLVRGICNFFSSGKIHTAHLKTYREKDNIGPLVRDEALFLNGLVRVLRPAVILEFGFCMGHSAFNFLQAMDGVGELFSFDIDDRCAAVVKAGFSGFNNFHFVQKSQTEFQWDDIGRKLVDIVFIDASHNLEMNQKTFQAVLPALGEGAIIAVHDTGTLAKEHVSDRMREMVVDCGGRWLNENELEPCPDERRFVNWIGAHILIFKWSISTAKTASAVA